MTMQFIWKSLLLVYFNVDAWLIISPRKILIT